MNGVLTLREAAKRLAVSDETIRRLIQAGEIHALRVGRQWRIPEREFDAFLVRASGKTEEPKQGS